MLRRAPIDDQAGWEPDFRWRGGDVSRIEGLTDGVFALALTLLVFSAEVPTTFAQLLEAFWQIPAFVGSFAILIWWWHCHYKVFRRYGIEDVPMVVANAALIFLVLFYAYMVKFLFAFLTELVRGNPNRARMPDGQLVEVFSDESQVGTTMMLYAAGFVAVFLVFAWMHRHAWSRREQLQLDPVEVFLARAEVGGHLTSAAVGLLSILVVLLVDPMGFWAGLCYGLLGPIHYLRGRRVERAVDALKRSGGAAATLVLAGLLLVPGCGPAADEEAAGPGPVGGSGPAERLVLVTLDTLRADHLVGPRACMPRLAAAAGQGLLFTRAFAATPVTQPTHASLFTGLHPWEHGVTRNGQVLPASRTTVAERLAEAGWTTAARVSSFPLERRFGWDQGFGRFEDGFEEGRDAKARAWEGSVQPDFERFYSLSDRVGARALELLDELDGERQFLWVHFYDPHAPYGDSLRGAKPEISTKQLGWLMQADQAKGQALLKIVKARYQDDVRAVDRALGLLLDRLAADDVPTHVVITADHGESLADDGSLGHGDRVTPQQVQVPLVILSPRVDAPARRDDVAGSVDVHATLLDLAGLPPAGAGRSLVGPPRPDALAVGMRRTYREPTEEVRADGTTVMLEGERFFLAQGAALLAGNGEGVEGSDDGQLRARTRAAFAAFSAALASGGAVDLEDGLTREALQELGYLK